MKENGKKEKKNDYEQDASEYLVEDIFTSA